MLQINIFLPQPHCYNTIMMFLSLFGFLCVNEFTIPTQTAYDHIQHFSVCDIALDSRQSLHLLQVRIKQSKTDQFCKGIDLLLCKTGTSIFPMNALMPYLVMQGTQAASLFITIDGKHFALHLFSSTVNTILQGEGKCLSVQHTAFV